MKKPIHKLIRTLLAAPVVAAFALAPGAHAQAPKTWRIIAPSSPGGILDQTSRVVAKALSESLGQPVIVENVAGAGGTLGIQAMLRAPADGHTLVMGSLGPNAANYTLQASLPYKAEDLSPVIHVLDMPNVLVASPKLGAQSMADLKRVAAARPQGLNMAVSTSGSSGHLAGELIKSRAGFQATNVIYRGASPALVDLMGGQVDIMVDNMITALPHIRAGKLVPIAVTTRTRSPDLPEVPTLAEAGVPEVDVAVWLGLFVSSKVPAPTVNELNAQLQKVLASAEVKRVFAQQGGTAVGGSAETFRAFVGRDTVRWAAVIRAADLKPE
ncbi:Tripartite tricarboxylate transporter family receptor [compost metagenome]